MKPFKGATFDSRAVKPGMLFVAVKGEKVDGRAFIPQALAAGAAEVVEGYEALAEVARDYRRTLSAPVIAVTGSAGKTTTKELLAAFLSRIGKTHATKGNFNNQLGLPITLLNAPAEADFVVVEMGTNHPGEIARLCDIAEPDAGVITNVGSAHLEFFGDAAGIAREKGIVGARAKSFFVIGENNVCRDQLKAMCRCEAVLAPCALDWLAKPLAAVLPGAHNLSNASLAYAVAARYGVTRDQALAALADFALPGARGRRLVKAGVAFIDDTYNANPDAMIAALEALKAEPCEGRRIAILGDMFELGPTSAALHARVFEHAQKLGLDAVIAVGEKSSACACTAAYPTVAALKSDFARFVSPGDLVLLKASHGMALGKLLEEEA